MKIEPTDTELGDAPTNSIYAELPSSVGDYKYGGGLYTDAQMRDFADRTHALRMEQAAPKASPATQQDVRCECCGYMTYHREHMGCIRAARAPAESVQRDAERLDWLEQHSQVNIERVRYLGSDESLYEVTPYNSADYDGKTLRAAIDAAMAAQGGNK